MAETTDPANEDGYTAELFTCFKCAATKRKLDEFARQSESTAGVYGYSTRDPSVTTS